MSTATQIGKALAKGYEVKRKIFLGAATTLKVLTGSQAPYTTTATYSTNWYLDKKEYSDLVAGKKYKLLKVADIEGTRLAQLKNATALQVGSVIYKFSMKESFIGAVPAYEFRLQATGEKV